MEFQEGCVMSGFTIEGLDAYIEQVISEKVAAALAQAEPDPWLDSKQAAAHLGVTVRRIHDLVHEGQLPRHGDKGFRLRFRRSELDAYVESRGH
jgi:excisionase family DNA binding protein